MIILFYRRNKLKYEVSKNERNTFCAVRTKKQENGIKMNRIRCVNNLE
jgi:hypothetical protein